MGKYFSNDSDLSNYTTVADESVDTTKLAMPTNHILNQSSSVDSKEILQQFPKNNDYKQPTTTDEHIDFVKNQNALANHMVNSYSEELKTKVKNQFELFSPAELFEKLNQIMFVLADLGNRISSLENTTKNNMVSNNANNSNNGKIELSNPEDLLKFEKSLEQNNPKPINDNTYLNPNEVKAALSNIRQGNIPKNIPSSEYIDNGLNLEEIFPHLDDEAYQAAYKAMSENKISNTDTQMPSPGNMRGITGF